MADFIILFKYESEEHPRKIEANFQELRFLEKTTPYSKSAMLSTLEYIPSVNLYSLLKEWLLYSDEQRKSPKDQILSYIESEFEDPDLTVKKI